ncbi:hypothetical protein [Streptomyces sp. gCLA4]|uniref:hypothetical protein n=1 Tax=Streptomyces sp. gCLA4 TaxID=1873416 RepID=UPI001600E2AA|nr:hypothetical protein [Streptomyces sp. gCLA4]
MSYPRAKCPVCERPVALLPTRRAGHGSVHDHKQNARALVLCGGSMQHVAYADALAFQDQLPEVEPAAVQTTEALALF